jgi:hypothetical protein
MATIIREKDVFTLTIPKDLIADKLVQKLIRLVNFRELTQDNAMTEKQAAELSEEIQEKWWAENKSWFLKDVEQ